MFWMHEWGFLYAGTPSNVALVKGFIESMGVENAEVFSRANIQQTVKTAYRRFVANFSSHELDAFDMTLAEFKDHGLSFFGPRFHSELARKIRDNASSVRDQMLVTGWGYSPISAMIYEVGPSYEALHSDACFAAIGSGGPLAQAMLMMLGQARHSTLAATIFNVACAKFSAEKSAGLDVGQRTAMYISRKPSEGDEGGRVYGQYLEEPDLQDIRDLWDRHLKPRIPDEARQKITKISASLSNGQISGTDMAEWVNASNRIQKAKIQAYEEIKAAIERDPQSPTDD